MDKDNDGYLVYDEYKAIYEAMDTNSDIRASESEVRDWVNENLDSICAQERARIIKRLAKQDKQDEEDTPPVN